MSLFGRFSIPIHSFGNIFNHSFALIVGVAQFHLSCCKALFCGFPIPLRCFGGVLRNSIAVVICVSNMKFSIR